MVGTVTYNTLVKVRIDASFVLWAVIFDPSNNDVCAIRELNWEMHVDSSVNAPPQKVSPPGAATAPTMDR